MPRGVRGSKTTTPPAAKPGRKVRAKRSDKAKRRDKIKSLKTKIQKLDSTRDRMTRQLGEMMAK